MLSALHAVGVRACVCDDAHAVGVQAAPASLVPVPRVAAAATTTRTHRIHTHRISEWRNQCAVGQHRVQLSFRSGRRALALQRRLARMWQARKHGPCAAQGPTKRPTYLTKAMRRRKFMIISLMPGVRREASDLQAGRQARRQAG